VRAFVKYTVARFALLLAVILVVLPIPRLDLILKLLIAFPVYLVLSYFLLRRWHVEAVAGLNEAMAQRRERKERLRAALAGEDEARSPDGAGPTRDDKA
jgi:hypothetical protein